MAADTISVRVSGKGPVRKYIAGDEAVVPFGSTASMLVLSLKIPRELPVICMKEGRRLQPGSVLHDGDSITIIAMMAGG